MHLLPACLPTHPREIAFDTQCSLCVYADPAADPNECWTQQVSGPVLSEGNQVTPPSSSLAATTTRGGVCEAASNPLYIVVLISAHWFSYPSVFMQYSASHMKVDVTRNVYKHDSFHAASRRSNRCVLSVHTIIHVLPKMSLLRVLVSCPLSRQGLCHNMFCPP